MSHPLSSDIEEFFSCVENIVGTSVMRAFAQLLTAAPHGLTSLEILDALSLNTELEAHLSDSLSLLAYSVIDKLGLKIHLLLLFIFVKSSNRSLYDFPTNSNLKFGVSYFKQVS